MAVTTRKFRAQTVPTVIMVLLTPVFCGLGIWQLDRAEQKRNLASTLEMRRKLPALHLTHELPDVSQLEYRRVIAKGQLMHDKTVLIENRKHQGKTGYHVITPLHLADSELIVLVNRGWIPRHGTQPAYPLPGGMLEIDGEANIPQPPAMELDLAAIKSTALPHWPYLTLAHYTDWSGLQVLPFVILQSPVAGEDFIRQWPQPKVSDAMHIGYAVHWFAFALITLLIWLRLSLHRQAVT